MVDTSVILAALFAVFCGALVVFHSFRLKRITLLDWSLLAIGGLYGFGWILVLTATESGRNPVWSNWITPFRSYYLMHTTFAYLLVMGIFAGWYLSYKIAPLGLPQSTSTRRKYHQYRLPLAFWTMLILALLFQGLYTNNYGGYFESLKYSSYIRSSLFENVPVNRWSFLKPFGGLTMIASYGFFGLFLSGHRRVNTAIGLAIAFGFSLYVLYSWLGRMGALVFFTTFGLGFILAKRPSPIGAIFWGSVSFLSLIVLAYYLSVFMNLKSANSLSEFLARELSYPFGSFFAHISSDEYNYRMLVDFLIAPAYLLPSSWIDFLITPAGQVNTEIIMGAAKGERGVTGGIPVDLITLGLMQAGVAGVVIVGGLFGLLIRIMQSFVDRIPNYGVRAVFEAYIALKISVLGVFYSQPNLVIAGNFALIVGGVIIIAFMKTPKLLLLQRKLQ